MYECQIKLIRAFYLKRKRANGDRKVPIYARITIDGLGNEFSFGYKVLPEDWDDEAKRLFASAPNYKTVNKKVSQAQTNIEQHFDQWLPTLADSTNSNSQTEPNETFIYSLN